MILIFSVPVFHVCVINMGACASIQRVHVEFDSLQDDHHNYVKLFDTFRQFPNIDNRINFKKYMFNIYEHPRQYKLIQNFFNLDRFVRDSNCSLNHVFRNFNILRRYEDNDFVVCCSNDDNCYDENRKYEDNPITDTTYRLIGWKFTKVIDKMKKIAQLYLDNRGWDNVGYYLHFVLYTNDIIYNFNDSVKGFRLHVVNLDVAPCDIMKLYYKKFE